MLIYPPVMGVLLWNMKIKKSVSESYNGENDDEIRNILRDTDLSDIEKSEKICDIINNSNRSYKPNLPKNIKIFKNYGK